MRNINNNMRLRKTYLCEDEATIGSATRTFNLDFTDPITAIYLDFIGQRYDKSDTNRPYLLEDIDKIEIVDGSDVLFSLSGTQCAAAQLYHTGKMPFMAISANHVAAYNRMQVKILFGKNEDDTEFALDCTKLVNPQLKVTHSYAEEAEHWKVSGQTMTVQALILEGAPKPRGFFMTKEIYGWTKATTGDETIDLPRDFPYRFIMLQAVHCATPVYAEFSKIKLSCNFDEFVPISETTEDLAHDNWSKYGMLTQQTEVIGEAAAESQVAWYPFAWNWGGDVQCWNTGAPAVVMRPYSGYITVNASFGVGLPEGTRAIVTGQGFELFDTEVIPFGNLMESAQWFQPQQWKSVRLILTQAQTAVPSSVVIQQVKPY